MSSIIKKAVSRRGFLRAVPAVPLAAPSIVESVKNGPLGANVVGNARSPQPDVMPMSEHDWIKHQRQKLQAIIDGKDEPDRFQVQCQKERGLAYHYDALRSLSPSTRAQLHAEAVFRMHAEERRASAIEQLADLARKFSF